MSNNFNKIVEILVKVFIFYGFLSLYNETKIIKIDNEIKESLFQNELNFSHFNTQYKIMTIYYTYMNIDGKKPINNDKQINLKSSLFYEEVNLAKRHGIFGFGIVYDWDNNSIYNEIILQSLSYIDKLNFTFFIILNFEIRYEEPFELELKQNNIKENVYLLENIKKYLLFPSYIKLNGKYVLGILDFSNLKYNFINYIRYYLNDNEISIWIISISYGTKNLYHLNEIDSFVKFPSQDIGLKDTLNIKYFYNFYNYNLFRKGFECTKIIKNFFIIHGTKPEKFYLILKKFLNDCENIQKNETIILFNSWNNYKENSYLEPDKEYGFSYLNYFSKAIFNFDDGKMYNLSFLLDKCKIAIQAHLFYDDLIGLIINKTNNIKVKFDLYISITSHNIYNNIENYINKYSNSSKFEILIFENKGRDVLPFLIQMKNKLSQYKYICHLHTKKTMKNPEIGFHWRNYLFNNLLGDANIISEILNDFESNEKLGFIFPETFYSLVKYIYVLRKETQYWMNFIFSKLFPGYKMGELLNFPAGNMFWAKTKAIFQIFTYDFKEYFPEEKDQVDKTIMHAIERIWLYLVKFNNFYYKIIFKFF